MLPFSTFRLNRHRTLGVLFYPGMSISHECVWFGSRLTQKIGRQAGPGEEDQLLSLFLPLSLSLSHSPGPSRQGLSESQVRALMLPYALSFFKGERGRRWVNLAPIYLFEPNNCQVLLVKKVHWNEKKSKEHKLARKEREKERESLEFVAGSLVWQASTEGEAEAGKSL